MDPGTIPTKSPTYICFLCLANFTNTPLPPSGCSIKLFLMTSSCPISYLILPITLFQIEKKVVGFFFRSQTGNLSGSTRSFISDYLPRSIMFRPREFLCRASKCLNRDSKWKLLAYWYCYYIVISRTVSRKVLNYFTFWGSSLRAASNASRYIWSYLRTKLYWFSRNFLITSLPE